MTVLSGSTQCQDCRYLHAQLEGTDPSRHGHCYMFIEPPKVSETCLQKRTINNKSPKRIIIVG